MQHGIQLDYIWSSAKKNDITVQTLHVSLDNQLTKFREIEEDPQVKHLTPEEACEQHFIENTELIDNRFMVRLPFKKSVNLGDSLDQATRTFQYLEKHLNSNPDLRHRYQEILKLEHMEEIPTDQKGCPANKCYYLPHHCVFKEDSTSTKLRVVFDGSAKTTTGVSINDALMVGPVVQDDSFSIINRFRFFKIALQVDIEKRYRQFGLKAEDRNFGETSLLLN